MVHAMNWVRSDDAILRCSIYQLYHTMMFPTAPTISAQQPNSFLCDLSSAWCPALILNHAR